jgi:hypothetical protein
MKQVRDMNQTVATPSIQPGLRALTPEEFASVSGGDIGVQKEVNIWPQIRALFVNKYPADVITCCDWAAANGDCIFPWDFKGPPKK